MKKQKLLFNQLLRMYYKCIRRRKNLVLTNRNHRRQLILSKQIDRLYEKLESLQMFIQKRAVAGTIAVGALLFAATESKAQTFGTVQANPFSLVTTGIWSSSTLADLDNDGDMDLLSAEKYGNFEYFQNTGTASAPVFGPVQTNPFSLSDIGNFPTPAFIDLDNDGDKDVLSGENNGSFYYFENTGTASSPAYGAVQTNPFSLIDIGGLSAPGFADLDNDGDFDLLSGEITGNFYYFENIGTASAPAFGPMQTNPFSLTSVAGSYSIGASTTSFADLDNDGDLDLLSGNNYGWHFYFENTGTASLPVFGPSQLNPFSLTSIVGGTFYSPEFVDLDNDGDMDLLSGEYLAAFYFFENITCDVSGIDVSTATSGVTVSANQAGATYQWIDCNNSNLPIAGETNQSFTTSVNGDYAVVISLGLCSDTSACVSITGVGIEESKLIEAGIVPNPTSGQITITTSKEFTNVKITDVNGRLILAQENKGFKTNVNLSSIENGMYFVQLFNGETPLTQTKKLVVNK